MHGPRSRATTRADRLAAEPPDTKHPPGLGGIPASSAKKLSAWFSAITAPAASSHEVPCSDEADTTMSNSSDAFVGAAGTNARNRGLSQEITERDDLIGKNGQSGDRILGLLWSPSRPAPPRGPPWRRGGRAVRGRATTVPTAVRRKRLRPFPRRRRTWRPRRAHRRPAIQTGWARRSTWSVRPRAMDMMGSSSWSPSDPITESR